ncbi:hypothetical protein NS220_06775 [Microbacterium testaceum]|uniref:Uncharacterized protein n=1 Tax=Microbacterium testaceum TaxID=2033 RepID=A0A147EYQ5_MICTE|nr:hypothetical protein [Microbacterium testaceum]KTR95169.1 hypothetical protein NS220_06775 [Microbacterium testaceum]
MTTYDVPDVGRVAVTFSTHRFGNSDQVLKTLDDVRDAAGRDVPYEVWEKVNQYLRAQGVVS